MVAVTVSQAGVTVVEVPIAELEAMTQLMSGVDLGGPVTAVIEAVTCVINVQ